MEENLRSIYDKLVSSGSQGSYEDFVSFFNENDQNKKNVYDKLMTLGSQGTYDEFLAFAGGNTQPQPAPQRVDVSDVEQAEQAGTPVAQQNEIPTVTMEQLDGAGHYRPRSGGEPLKTPEQLEAEAIQAAGVTDNPEESQPEVFGKEEQRFAPSYGFERSQQPQVLTEERRQALNQPKPAMQTVNGKTTYDFSPENVQGMREFGERSYQSAFDKVNELMPDIERSIRERALFDIEQNNRNKGASQEAIQYHADKEADRRIKRIRDLLENGGVTNNGVDFGNETFLNYLSLDDTQLREQLQSAFKDKSDYDDYMAKYYNSPEGKQERMRQLDDADATLQEIRNKRSQSFWESVGGMVAEMGIAASMNAGPMPVETQQELMRMQNEIGKKSSVNMAINQQLHEAENTLGIARKNIEEGKGDVFTRLGRGVRYSDLDNLIPVSELYGQMGILQLYQKLDENGNPKEQLTEDEKTLYEALVVNEYISQTYGGEVNMLNRIGRGLPEQAEFTLSFLLASEFGGAQAIGKGAEKFAAKGISRAVKKEIKSGLKKYMLDKALPTLFGMGVETAYRTGLQVPTIAAGAIERHVGNIKIDPETGEIGGFENGVDWGEALWKSTLSVANENVTELMGERWFDPGWEWLGRNTIAGQRIADFRRTIGEIGNGRVDNILRMGNDISAKAGWNGWAFETLEELAGNFNDAAFIHDQTWKEAFSSETLMETTLNCMIFGMVMGSSTTATQALRNLPRVNETRNAKRMASSIIGKMDGISTEELDQHINEDSANELADWLVSKSRQGNSNGDWTDAQRAAVANYVKASVAQKAQRNFKGMQLQEDVSAMESEVDEMTNNQSGDVIDVNFEIGGQKYTGTVIGGRVSAVEDEVVDDNGQPKKAYIYNPHLSTVTLSVRYDDGTGIKKTMIPARSVTSINDITNTEQYKAERTAELESEMQRSVEDMDRVNSASDIWGVDLQSGVVLPYNNGLVRLDGKDGENRWLLTVLNADGTPAKDAQPMVVDDFEFRKMGMIEGLRRLQQQGAPQEEVDDVVSDINTEQTIENVDKSGSEDNIWDNIAGFMSGYVKTNEEGDFVTDESRVDAAAGYLMSLQKGDIQRTIDILNKRISELDMRLNEKPQEPQNNGEGVVAMAANDNLADSQAEEIQKQIDFLTAVDVFLGERLKEQQQISQAKADNLNVSQMETGMRFPIQWNNGEAVARIDGVADNGNHVVSIWVGGVLQQEGIDDISDQDWEALRIAQQPQQEETEQQPAETEQPAQQEEAPVETPVDQEPQQEEVTPESEYEARVREQADTAEEFAALGDNDYIKANLTKAQNDLAKAEKQKPKSEQADKRRQELTDINNAKAKAREVLDFWQAVDAEQRRRQAERIAAQQAANEQRRAEAVAEEQARQEAEERKVQERAELGSNNVAPSIREKWDSAEKAEGAPDEITLANGERVAGHYVLVESGAASASHDALNGFAKTEGFPLDENEQSVNDRDYERDKNAQQITRQIANEYDSRALQDPVVVSQDGVVLSGNGRTMAGEIAAAQDTDGAYIDYLKKYAPKYGFTPEQVEGMAHPRVVFVPDASMPYTAETFAKFNQQEMKGQSKTEQAVKLGKLVDDATFGRIIRSINRFDTLGDFYADTNATADAIGELLKAGAINQMQHTEMFDGDAISAQGREILENMLIGKAFESNPDAVRQLAAYKSLRQSVITALAEISNNIALGEYSLESELSDAIALAYNARKNGYKAGDAVSEFARQGKLFETEEDATAADYTNATVLMLADLLNDNRVTRLKKAMAVYNKEAQQAAGGQSAMAFDEEGNLVQGGVKTQQDILNEVLLLLQHGTETEQQQAIDAAVEQRKAEAGRTEGVQQDGNAGEGVQGNGAVTASETTETEKSDIEEAKKVWENLCNPKNITNFAADKQKQEEWVDAHFEEIVEAYIAANGNKLDPDELRRAFAAIGYDGTNVDDYRDQEGRIVSELYSRMLRAAVESGNTSITLLTGVGGAGKSTATKSMDLSSRGLVYDSAFNKYLKLRDAIDKAKEFGMTDIQVVAVHNDAVTAFNNAVNRGIDKGRFLSLKYFTKAFQDNAGKIKALRDNYPDVEIICYDNTWNQSDGQPVSLDEAVDWDYTIDDYLISKLLDILENGINEGRFTANQAAALGRELPKTAWSRGSRELEITERISRINERIQQIGVEVLRPELPEERGGDRRRGMEPSPGDNTGDSGPTQGPAGEESGVEGAADVFDETGETSGTSGNVEGVGESIEDSAPLSLADMRGETEQTGPKQVSVEGLFNDLKTKGEAKLSDNVVDQQVQAANEEVDTNPTEAQKEAGNYKKGHVTIDGFDISIENPAGSTRSGTDAQGNPWSVTMHNSYGYIRMTEGVDGDHIDIFLSDHIDDWNGTVYVVDQVNADGSFDEHKVMYGFNSAEEAREAYLSNYSEGWQGLGIITGVSREEFKKWVDSSHRKTKAFADYKSVQTTDGQNEAAMESQQTEEEKQFSPWYGTIDDAPTPEGLKRGQKARLFEDGERAYRNASLKVPTFQLGVEKKVELTYEMFEKEYADIVGDFFMKEDRPYLKEFYDYFNARMDAAAEIKSQPERTEQQPTTSTYGASNKIVSQSRYEELKRRMQEKLGGQMNMGIDPEILAIGTEMAVYHIEAGARKFADFCKNMVADLGDAIRPYLKSFYNAVRDLPEVEEAGYLDELTPYEEVKSFDVNGFDKGGSTFVETAQEAVKENEVAQQAEEATEKLKQQRNDGRKLQDGELSLRPATEADFESEHPTVYYQGKPYGVIMVMRSGEQIGAAQFSKPHIDRVYLTNGQDVTIEQLQVVDRDAEEKTKEIARKGKKSASTKKKDVSSQTSLFGEETEIETKPQDDGLQRNDVGSSEGLPAHSNQSAINPEGLGETEREEGGRADRGGQRDSSPVTGRPAGRVQELRNTHNNHAERGTDYAPKGVDARIEANIKAIELMQQLIESGEQATPEQMAVLRQFSGWGGLGKAFQERVGYGDSGYDPRLRSDYQAGNPIAKRLRELLGDEAYEQANMSRNSAYYTPAEVIDTLWDIARAMGFKGGNVLEGSAGIGNIIGLMPTDMSQQSSIHAVEIDQTTGNILSLLYPDAKVEVQGFEATQVENGSVDLAITNVPFVTGLRVNDTTGDKDLSRRFHDIHDFCIAKNIRKLREGGIGIFITSSGTLDNSAKLREWIVNEGGADVVGAFRMNNATFGGTGVTSDIIVVRKRVNGKKSQHAIDVAAISGERVAEYDTGETKKVKGQEVRVVKQLSMDYNKYFIEHPEMMAGEMQFGFERGETFRPTSKALYPTKDKDQSQMLADFVRSFEGKEWEAALATQQTEQANVYEELGADVKEGSMLVNKDGVLCVAQRGKAVPLEVNANKVKGHTKVECFNAYQAIKQALADVLSYQTENESDDGLQPLLDKLNKAFDSFVKTYGNLHKNTSITFLKGDVDWPNILALEKYSESNNAKGERVQSFGKTDIFSKRVVEKEKEPEPKNVKDGIIASIYMFGRVDVPYISEHLGMSEEEVREEIVKEGLGFENPATRQMEVIYEYLSGNMREKLQQAKDNNTDGRYDANIKALERVIPMNIPAHLIDFTIGSSWVDPKLYEEYVKERTDIDVRFTAAGGTWFMKAPNWVNAEKNRAMGVVSEMLHKTIMGTQLIEAAMQNKTITVSETRKKYDGTTETTIDREATQACAAKIDEIRQDFKDWARAKMQSDPEMSERMGQVYNELFNNYVPKEIPEEFAPLRFSGMASVVKGKPFSMNPHQAKAAIRATTQPLLLAHEVGSGKTITLIATAMEMRRLGTAKKPMIVVQNSTVGQFVESAKQLYPNAKVLTIEEADRTVEGRKNFYAKIKYNDWDMIVVPQSVFERIPDSEERQMAYVQDKIEEKLMVLEQMRDADDSGNNMIVRQAEREISQLEDQLAGLSEAIAEKRKTRDAKKEAVTRQNAEVKALEMLDRQTDDVENFDDMGIDAILVDEAHEYKHLGFATAMQRGVKGVDPSYSKKAQGVFLKAQAVMEKNNGRNVVFATGTPISNTAAEIWTFMRYLMPADTMKQYGIYYFDDFVRNFGNLQQMLEFTTSGKFKENNRFAGYVNLPELVRIWSGVSDTVLNKDIEEERKRRGGESKIPELEGGKAQDIYLPQTKALRAIMKYVKGELERFEKMSGKDKKANSHIPLVMYGIAKAAAVDARLVDETAEDDPNSKTNEAVRQTLRSLEETKDYRGTVALFADNYQNKVSGFNIYEDIRKKLIEAGVPESEVVVMKSGMSDKKKLEIFDKVKKGEIRVILGSTFTLGTGVNIQDRLHTLIHLDAPNRPMDYTQRNGRILRQGNMHKVWGIPVRVLRFGVEDSLDVTAYQRLKTKGAIADSIMHGKDLMLNSMENRVMEEEEDVFGDTVAQLSGSEYAMLKNQAEKELRKLQAKRKQWEADQTYVHNRIPRLQGSIRAAQRRLEEEKGNLEKLSSMPEHPTITIGKHTFKSLEDMADFIKEYNAELRQDEAYIRGNMSTGQKKERTMTVNVGGIDFKIHLVMSLESVRKGTTLSSVVKREMTYECPALGMENVPVHQMLFRNALEDILTQVVTGVESRDNIESAQRVIERDSHELEQLKARDGKPFEFEAELKQASERLEEYTAAMKKEMEEKEAKYADMDSEVEAATGLTEAEEAEEEETPDLSIREEEPPVRTGIGYKVFVLKDGKLYPPMVANPNGEATPVGVWLDADAAPIAGESKTGRPQVKAGGKGTQGGSGQLAYRPGWHLGTIPYAIQFNRKDENGEKTLFPKDFVWAEVEYADDVDYQQEAESYGVTENGKYRHSYAGLPRVPKDGSYTYRTNPNPETDPWIITGAMKVKRILTPSEVDEMVREAGREPQRREAGAVTDEQVKQLNNGIDESKKVAYNAVRKALANAGIMVVKATEDDIENLKSKRKSIRDSKGVLRGWVDKGIIYLTDDGMDAETPIHEYTHLWAEAFQMTNPEVWEDIKDMLKGTPEWELVANSNAYSYLKGDDEIAGEVLSRISGKDNGERMEVEARKAIMEAPSMEEAARTASLLQRMRDALKKFWTYIGKMLWGKRGKVTREQVADMVLADLVNNINPFDPNYSKRNKGKSGREDVSLSVDIAEGNPVEPVSEEELNSYDSGRMSHGDIVANTLVELANKNKENVQRRIDAVRALGNSLQKVRQAMAAQRAYDKTTVDQIVRLAQIMMKGGMFKDFSNYEVRRLLSMAKNATGRNDITKQANAVVNLMLDHALKEAQSLFEAQMKVKGSKVGTNGVEVQGKLDVTGQRMMAALKDGIALDTEALEERIAEVTDRMGSDDKAIADNAALEYQGLMLAKQYHDNIKHDEEQVENLRSYIKEAKEYLDAGYSNPKAYKEFVESCESSIRRHKADRIGAYIALTTSLGSDLKDFMGKAKAFREREEQRVKEIQHNANSDLQGKPADEHKGMTRWQRAVNSNIVRFFMKPIATFNEMLRFFGGKSVDGQGYLWNRFMGGWVDASDKEWKNLKKDHDTLDDKATEVMGDKMRWADLLSMERKMPTVTVTFRDGDEMKEHELSQGNALYIYIVNKMDDGKMKLRRMGITEDDVDEITRQIDPRFIALADWMQNEYLPKKRNDFNEVHERMFGAPMAAIEDYFPLVINSRSRGQEEDISNPTTNEAKPSTITGSIIKRKTNTTPLDLTNADAFGVILGHLRDMEHWAAYAELNRDMNTLLSYKRFKNRVLNMSSVRFGAGETLWKNFKDVCSIVADVYHPKVDRNSLDNAMVNISKGVTSAKISFRVYTAFKQLLSYPAYFAEASAVELAKSTAQPAKAFNWALDELPGFAERWQSKQAGDSRLKDTDADWDFWKNKIVDTARRWGMTPNAFVDAMTVAMGAKAIYETKLKRYKADGYSEEEAKRKALKEASVAYNETQQSNQNAYLSAMQLDRTVASVALTVFRNASMGYQRRMLRAVDNIKRKFMDGYKEESIAFMTKQGVREGLTEEQAKQAAERAWNRSIYKDIANAVIFGFIMQFPWNLGAYLPYLMFGDDDDEKDKLLEDAALHAFAGPVEGLTGGSIISELYNMARSGKDISNYNFNLLPIMGDLQNTLKHFKQDDVRGWNDVVNLLIQAGVGVNPQTISDAAVAIVDATNGDLGTAKEIGFLLLRMAQVPQSQLDQLYIDELGMSAKDAKGLDYETLAKRYAEYKANRDAPLTGWLYSDESRQKAEQRYMNRFQKMIQERIAEMDEDDLDRNMDGDNVELKRLLGKEIAGRLEGKDTEGNKPASNWKEETQRAHLAYQRNRDYIDVVEDVLMRKAQTDADAEYEAALAEGDYTRAAQASARANAIEKARKQIGKMKASLGAANGQYDAQIMENIRAARKQYMNSLGIR